MNRWLSVLVLVIILLLAGGWLMWYFAYGVDDQPPGQDRVSGLSGPVRIGWHDEGFVTIEAPGEADALAGLGYAQGIRRGWYLLLLRQTALGRQAEWFGDSLLAVDRLARRLELATLAEQAYGELSGEDQALLEAFTRGLNAALQSKAVGLSEEIALLDLEPEPWAPWHTLAVEHLFAWLVVPRPSLDSLAQAGADAQAFFEADALLRETLHLHGFEHSAAWAVRDSSGTYFYERQIFGDTALPFYFEAALQWPGATLTGATVPGTPYFLTGKTQERAWALLPEGSARLVFTAGDTTSAKRYDRVVSMDGTEQLLTLRRTGTALYFDPPPQMLRPPPPDTLAQTDTLAASLEAPDTTQGVPPGPDSMAIARPDTIPKPPDSTWTLQWVGFQPVTDWTAWRSLTTGNAADFQLVRDAGLAIDQSGDWQVIGSPEAVVALQNGVVAGNTPWVRYLARDLDSLVAGTSGLSPAQWATDYQSTWAESLAPAMIASIDSIPNRSPEVEEALTYLRNWDFSYDRTSIAAPIFDTWVTLYRDSTGTLPMGQVPDTVYFENLLRYQLLAVAVAQLRRQFGRNMSQWRWENVYPDVRYFPVWSADSLIAEGTGLFAGHRFGPVRLPGSGHPTTLAWGPSPVQEDGFHPAVWEAWISTSAWDAFTVRRRLLDLSGFLSRYRISERPPLPVVIAPSTEPERVTTLTPPPS